MNLSKVEKEVIEVAQEVGEFIRKEGASFDFSRAEQKQRFNNLVSYVDKEAEQRLVQVLEKIIPGSNFLAEEGSGLSSTSSPYKWIIDPLDGTTNFMHGLPVYSVSIALQKDNQTILGVVYEVNRDECFHSIGNNEAYCNASPVKISAAQTLNESLLATGFPYDQFDKRDAYLNIIKEFLNKSHGIRRMGSAAVDLIYVACGRMDGFFEYNLNPWDVAAGAFIVEQAGGKVTDFKGGPDFLHSGEIIAAGAIHEQMVSVITSHW